MVQFLPVAQLMHNHIVQHVLRAEHQQAVEVQVALGGAAAPAGFLVPDGDPAVGDAHLFCPGRHPGRDLLQGAVGQGVHFLRRQLRQLRPGADLRQGLFNPAPLALQHLADLPFRHAQRRPDGNFARVLNADAHAPAPAPDQMDMPRVFHAFPPLTG